MSRLHNFLFYLGIALWLGGCVLIFFAAGAIFDAMPSRELAGKAAGVVIGRFQLLTYLSGLMLIISIIGIARQRGWGMISRIKIGIAAFTLAVSLYTGLVVQTRMQAIKAEMGPIDAIPESNPLRAEFRKLHGMSFGFNALNGGLIFVLFLLEVAGPTRQSAATKE